MSYTTDAIKSRIEEVIRGLKNKITSADNIIKSLDGIVLYEIGIDKSTHRIYSFEYVLSHSASHDNVTFTIKASPLSSYSGEQDRTLTLEELQKNYIPYSVNSREILPGKK